MIGRQPSTSDAGGGGSSVHKQQTMHALVVRRSDRSNTRGGPNWAVGPLVHKKKWFICRVCCTLRCAAGRLMTLLVIVPVHQRNGRSRLCALDYANRPNEERRAKQDGWSSVRNKCRTAMLYLILSGPLLYSYCCAIKTGKTARCEEKGHAVVRVLNLPQRSR